MSVVYLNSIPINRNESEEKLLLQNLKLELSFRGSLNAIIKKASEILNITKDTETRRLVAQIQEYAIKCHEIKKCVLQLIGQHDYYQAMILNEFILKYFPQSIHSMEIEEMLNEVTNFNIAAQPDGVHGFLLLDSEDRRLFLFNDKQYTEFAWYKFFDNCKATEFKGEKSNSSDEYVKMREHAFEKLCARDYEQVLATLKELASKYTLEKRAFEIGLMAESALETKREIKEKIEASLTLLRSKQDKRSLSV